MLILHFYFTICKYEKCRNNVKISITTQASTRTDAIAQWTEDSPDVPKAFLSIRVTKLKGML